MPELEIQPAERDRMLEVYRRSKKGVSPINDFDRGVVPREIMYVDSSAPTPVGIDMVALARGKHYSAIFSARTVTFAWRYRSRLEYQWDGFYTSDYLDKEMCADLIKYEEWNEDGVDVADVVHARVYWKFAVVNTVVTIPLENFRVDEHVIGLDYRKLPGRTDKPFAEYWRDPEPVKSALYAALCWFIMCPPHERSRNPLYLESTTVEQL